MLVEIFLVLDDWECCVEVEAGLELLNLHVEREGVVWTRAAPFIVPDTGPVRVRLEPIKRGEA